MEVDAEPALQLKQHFACQTDLSYIKMRRSICSHRRGNDTLRIANDCTARQSRLFGFSTTCAVLQNPGSASSERAVHASANSAMRVTKDVTIVFRIVFRTVFRIVFRLTKGIVRRLCHAAEQVATQAVLVHQQDAVAQCAYHLFCIGSVTHTAAPDINPLHNSCS